jgi:hypothetical protein
MASAFFRSQVGTCSACDICCDVRCKESRESGWSAGSMQVAPSPSAEHAMQQALNNS